VATGMKGEWKGNEKEIKIKWRGLAESVRLHGK